MKQRKQTKMSRRIERKKFIYQSAEDNSELRDLIKQIEQKVNKSKISKSTEKGLKVQSTEELKNGIRRTSRRSKPSKYKADSEEDEDLTSEEDEKQDKDSNQTISSNKPPTKEKHWWKRATPEKKKAHALYQKQRRAKETLEQRQARQKRDKERKQDRAAKQENEQASKVLETRRKKYKERKQQQRNKLKEEHPISRAIRKARIDLLSSVKRCLETPTQREARLARSKVGGDTNLSAEERTAQFKRLNQIVDFETEAEKNIRYKLVIEQLLIQFDPDQLQSLGQEMGFEPPPTLNLTSSALNVPNSDSSESEEEEEEQKKWPDETLEDWTIRLSTLAKRRIESQKDKKSIQYKDPSSSLEKLGKSEKAAFEESPLSWLIQQKATEKSIRLGNLEELKAGLSLEKAERVVLYQKELEVISKSQGQDRTVRLKEALEGAKEYIPTPTPNTCPLEGKTKDPLEQQNKHRKREVEAKRKRFSSLPEATKAEKRAALVVAQAVRNKLIKDEWSLFYQLLNSPSPAQNLESEESKEICERVYKYNLVSKKIPPWVDTWRRKLYLLSNEQSEVTPELEEQAKASRIERNNVWIKQFLSENDNQKLLEGWLYERKNRFVEYLKKRHKNFTPEQKEMNNAKLRENYRKRRLAQGKDYNTAEGRRGPRNISQKKIKAGYPTTHSDLTSASNISKTASKRRCVKAKADSQPKQSNQPNLDEIGDSLDCSSLSEDFDYDVGDDADWLPSQPQPPPPTSFQNATEGDGMTPLFNEIVNNLQQGISNQPVQHNVYNPSAAGVNSWNPIYSNQQQSDGNYSLQFHPNHQVLVFSNAIPYQVQPQPEQQWDQNNPNEILLHSLELGEVEPKLPKRQRKRPGTTPKPRVAKKKAISRLEKAVHSILEPQSNENPPSPEPEPGPDPFELLPPLPSCPECLLSFETESALSNHIKLTHTTKPESSVPCPVCSKSYFNKSILIKHIWSQHYGPLKSKECPHCNKPFSRHGEHRLTKHIKLTHPNEANWYILGAPHCKKQLRADIFKCSKCAEQFEGYLELVNHSVAEHSFGCKFCGIILRSEDHLNDHFSTFHPNAETLSGADEYLAQLKSSEVRDSFNCVECDSKFLTREYLLEHERGGHFNSSFREGQRASMRCDPWKRDFKKKDLILHQDRGCPLKVFKCYWCKEDFKEENDLQQHLTEKHCKEKNIPTRFPVGHFEYKCELCIREYSSLIQLRKHFGAAHQLKLKEIPSQTQPPVVAPTSNAKESLEEKTFSCPNPNCDAKFSPSQLHLIHGEWEKLARRTCSICNKTFKRPSTLTTHNQVKHKIFTQPIKTLIPKEVSLSCLKCMKFEIIPETFHEMHIKMNPLIQETSLVCEICGLKLSSRLAYKRHKINKHGDAGNEAEIEFTQQQQQQGQNSSYEVPSIALTEAVEVHGVAVYPCVACPRKYKTLDFLKSHFSSVHPWSQEKILGYIQSKNYCKLCKKSFASPDSYRTHVRLVHETEGFECSHCPFKAKRIVALRNHLKRDHQNEDPNQVRTHRKPIKKDVNQFKCTICHQYSFQTEAKLRLHISNIHKIQNCKFCEFCGLQVVPAIFRSHRSRCKQGMERKGLIPNNSTPSTDTEKQIEKKASTSEETKKLTLLKVLELVESICPSDRLAKNKSTIGKKGKINKNKSKSSKLDKEDNEESMESECSEDEMDYYSDSSGSEIEFGKKVSLKDVFIKPKSTLTTKLAKNRTKDDVKQNRISRYGISILSNPSNLTSVGECIEQSPFVLIQRCDTLIQHYANLMKSLREQRPDQSLAKRGQKHKQSKTPN